MDVHETDLFRKLETIKEIRNMSAQLQKVGMKLKNEFDVTENEEKCLQEYKIEMELLQQEKMAHVEELRLIHADINLMESTIKQAEEERVKALESAKHLYEEQAMMREQIDILRSSIGLDRLSENSRDSVDEKIPFDLFERPHYPNHADAHAATVDDVIQPITIDPYPHLRLPDPRGFRAFPQNLSAAALVSAQVIPRVPPQQKPESRQSPGCSGMGGGANNSRGGAGGNLSSAGSFRQQPPPMKACLSCHQQIHRNAPICPLCKAKSRSRNPKKPKRKLDD